MPVSKKRFSTIISICVMLTLNAVGQQTKTSTDTLRVFPVDSKSDLATLRAALEEKTEVPVLLPVSFPYTGGDNEEDNRVWASIVLLDSTGYELALGWGKNCFSADLPQGAGACHYGTIRGNVETLTENEGRRSQVALTRGVKGYYVSFGCYAFCGDGAVGWERKGYHYSISMKAGSKAEITKVANSAIAQQYNK